MRTAFATMTNGAAAHLTRKVLALLGAEGDPRDLTDVLGSGVLVLAIRVAGAALAYLSVILLVRWMGVFEFGVYAYVWSWVLFVSVVLPLGLSSALMRFVPEYQARGLASRLAGVVLQSRRIIAGASVAAALSGALATVALRGVIPDHYFMPVLMGLAALPLLAQIDLYVGLSRALGWAVLAFGPFYVLQPLLLLAGLGVMVALGYTPTAAAALAVMVVCVAVTLAVLVGRVDRGMRETVADVPARMHTRYWLAISLPLLLMESFRALLEQTDILALGALGGPEDVAVYFAALRTAGVLGFVHFAVAALAVPKIARIHAAGTTEQLQRFVTGAAHLQFWPSMLGAAALVVLGPFLLRLFDPSFAAGYAALVVLVGSFLVRAAAGPVEFMLNMTGHQVACARILAIAAAVNLALNLALIPLWGLTGAAIATAMATLLSNGLLLYAVWRRLGIVSSVASFGLVGPRAR